MNDEDYDKPYSYAGSGYKRYYMDEDTDYSTPYKESEVNPGSRILESYYDDFDLDELVDDSTSRPFPEKIEPDVSLLDEYEEWDPAFDDEEEEEEYPDTTILGGDFHVGSEVNGSIVPKTANQELLDWAKDRPGVNENSSSDEDTVSSPENAQRISAQKFKKKILDGLEDAFTSRSKVLPPKTPNILDPLPPVTSLKDYYARSPDFEVTTRIQMTRSKADVLYTRLMDGNKMEPETWLGQDMLDRIGFEELCELIDIDVDPESEAGEFLQSLHDTYVSMIDDIMMIPHPDGIFYDPGSYAVVQRYRELTSSKSKEELENLAFEFVGDEDTEYVEKIAEAVFASLNKIFNKASGWGSSPEPDF